MKTPQAYKIIRYPSVTEKNTTLRNKNKYVFEVEPQATKPVIREAVEALFKVNVLSVNTMVVKGKFKRQGKFAGYKSNWKKAIVRLKDGQKIDKFGEV
jgi:large subunit ribosomal protein L23